MEKAAPGAGESASPSAELNMPGPHPFFKKPAANQNITPAPQGQAAEAPLASTGTGDAATAPRVAGGGEPANAGPGAGGARMSGAGPKKPDPVEQYKQQGGKVTQVEFGKSGLKRPPKPPREITAAPREKGFEQQREEKLGSAENSPEMQATQSKKSRGGGEEPVSSQVGNFAHNRLPGYMAEMRARLARAKLPADRVKLEAQIAEMEKMTQWPAGVEPNHVSFTMSDGRPGIPDGLSIENGVGVVWELKPNTESEWAQRGPYQASEYAEVLNEMHYAGRTNWEVRVITYDAERLTAKLREWGILPPEETPTPEPESTE
ncbi:MAG TPA: hypothetical protein VMD29_12845 [Terracidiphilus sp.]|nr:hypothetical protein [Terracidiphilus sp.]